MRISWLTRPAADLLLCRALFSLVSQFRKSISEFFVIFLFGILVSSAGPMIQAVRSLVGLLSLELFLSY